MMRKVAIRRMGSFRGECPIRETGRQVTVHLALRILYAANEDCPGLTACEGCIDAWVL